MNRVSVPLSRHYHSNRDVVFAPVAGTGHKMLGKMSGLVFGYRTDNAPAETEKITLASEPNTSLTE